MQPFAARVALFALALGAFPTSGTGQGVTRAPLPACADPVATAASTTPVNCHGYAAVDGLRMYYELRGAGPALVLLHGGGSTIETTFGRVIDSLAKTHRIVAIELQAAGHTNDVAGRPLTFERDADDVAQVLDVLHVASADVFGFSNGANTAMQLAMRHPSSVRRIVFASGFTQAAGLDPHLFAGLRQATPASMPAALRSAYLSTAPDPSALPAMVAKSTQRMLSFVDWPDSVVARVGVPTLVMGGDRDVMSVEHLAHVARTLPHGELVIFPNADHGAYIGEASAQMQCPACPQAAAMVIDAFLAEPAPR